MLRETFKIRDQKLAGFDPRIFYSSKKTSALHSLETFVSQVDFDKVDHQKVFGSRMRSPSATSAFLIYSSKWDLEAEEYSRYVISSGAGSEKGNVPSAFPSHIFELSWASNQY